MSDGIARLSVAELSAEGADERVDPDAFDRLGVTMQPIELATSLGVAQVLPVGGLVAGAREAGLFDEGFQQDRPVRITGMPVVREASGDQGEDARGEVTAPDPRQDEEASNGSGIRNSGTAEFGDSVPNSCLSVMRLRDPRTGLSLNDCQRRRDPASK